MRATAAFLTTMILPPLLLAAASCEDRPGDDDDGTSADDDSAQGDDDAADDDSADDDDATEEPDPTADLPACEGSVLAAFTEAEIQPPAVASNGYVLESGDTLEGLRASAEALLAGDAATALASVALVGYELCGGQGAQAGTALWRPAEPGTGRALFAWRATGARPLIVEAPHPFYEQGTLDEAVLLFETLPARALIASGTHRCSNTAASACDGGTSACGGNGVPYRISDQGHVTETVFQVAHEVLSSRHEEAWVLSLHGMSEAGLRISDGTLEASGGGDPLDFLAVALAAAFPSETLASCNDGSGETLGDHLCGTTSAQGRATNGAADACTEEAPASSGRFLHLEQSSAVRAQPEALRDALGEALP
jgi:hypothetical protein